MASEIIEPAGHVILVKGFKKGIRMWRLQSDAPALHAAVAKLINSRRAGRVQPVFNEISEKGSTWFDQKAIGNYIAGEQIQCFPEKGTEKKASLVTELLGIVDPREINKITSNNSRLQEIAKGGGTKGEKAHELIKVLTMEEANKKRLITKIFSGKSNTKAIALAWSAGMTSIGSATIQYADHGNGNQYWINEVCKTGWSRPSPVPSVLQDCEAYIRHTGATSAWLMVEISPEHGFGAGLNKYYGGKGYIMKYKYGEYSIMEKPFSPAITATDKEVEIQGEINTLVAEASTYLKSRGISTKKATISQIPAIQAKYEKVIAKLPPMPSAPVLMPAAPKKRKMDSVLQPRKKSKATRSSLRLSTQAAAKKGGRRRTRRKRKKVRRKTKRRRKKRPRHKKTRRRSRR